MCDALLILVTKYKCIFIRISGDKAIVATLCFTLFIMDRSNIDEISYLIKNHNCSYFFII